MEILHVAPERRWLLRLAIYGSLAALVLALVLGSRLLQGPQAGPDTSWFNTDFESQPDVRLLQEYVQIDTTQETGSEIAGAEFLARELEAAGIPVTLERLGENSANLWAVLEGDDPEALVLHHHIDVFGIGDPEAWTSPPFAAAIEPPWIYGRGVFDMKSVAIAQLQAIKALAERGRPRRTVIFLATGSEEAGSELGTRWILARHPELTRRFWAVLTEGGVVEATTANDVKYWGIEFGQRRYAEGMFCSSDLQQLERLRQEILAWGSTRQQVSVNREVATFLARYAPSRTRQEYQEGLRQTWAVLHDPARFRQLPDYLRSMFQSEAVPFFPEEDPAGGYRMRLVLQLLPGDDPDSVRRRLLPDWLTHGVSWSLAPALGADSASPLDHPLYRELEEEVRSAFPDTLVGPYFQPWSATDSRFFRQAGIPSYGFSPFVIFSTDTFRVDASNERLGLPGYVAGVELYRRIVLDLAG